jgi:hypothetical protein
MPDLQDLFDRSARAAGATLYWTTRTARLMVGVPDYETYVAHRRANHPEVEPAAPPFPPVAFAVLLGSLFDGVVAVASPPGPPWVPGAPSTPGVPTTVISTACAAGL